MHNEAIKQQPVNFLDLERAYSDFATNFITTAAKKKQPFFLYYPSHVSTKSSLWQSTPQVGKITLQSAQNQSPHLVS